MWERRCEGDEQQTDSFVLGVCTGGIDWMTRAELAEAIPPAYTEFLGKQLIAYIKGQEVAGHGKDNADCTV